MPVCQAMGLLLALTPHQASQWALKIERRVKPGPVGPLQPGSTAWYCRIEVFYEKQGDTPFLQPWRHEVLDGMGCATKSPYLVRGNVTTRFSRWVKEDGLFLQNCQGDVLIDVIRIRHLQFLFLQKRMTG